MNGTVVRVALRPFVVADNPVRIALAAGNDTRVRRRHLGACAQSQRLSQSSPSLAENRRSEVDVAVDAGGVGMDHPRQ